jgi:hypothetical protein
MSVLHRRRRRTGGACAPPAAGDDSLILLSLIGTDQLLIRFTPRQNKDNTRCFVGFIQLYPDMGANAPSVVHAGPYTLTSHNVVSGRLRPAPASHQNFLISPLFQGNPVTHSVQTPLGGPPRAPNRLKPHPPPASHPRAEVAPPRPRAPPHPHSPLATQMTVCPCFAQHAPG